MLKRAVSLFLSIVMILSMVPLQAFAEEQTTEPTEAIEETSIVTETTEPLDTEPLVTEPVVTEPVVTELVVTEPVVTEPVVTEPVVTEPVVTEPEVTEPVVTEPVVTEPEETEPVSGITTYPTREDFVPQEGPAYHVEVKPETFTRTEEYRELITDAQGHNRYETHTETFETEMLVAEEVWDTPIRTFAWRQESGDYYFTTFEDLLELSYGYYSAPSYAYYEGEGPLVISEDITLPENLRLSFGLDNSGLVINKGVTLDVAEDLNVGYLDIRGTLITRGYLWITEELNISGTLYLQDSNAGVNYEAVLNITGDVITNEEWCRIYRSCSVETIEELRAVVAVAKTDKTELEYDINFALQEDTVLTESITIPANTELFIYNYYEDCTFTIAQGATLTLEGTDGRYNSFSTDMIVHGTLVNNTQLNINETETLTFSETGKYSGMGYLVVRTEDWLDVVKGLPGNVWAEEWYNYEGERYWEIMDVTGMTQLATPFEPTWHKEIQVWGQYDEKTDTFIPKGAEAYDSAGHIAWRAKQPHQAIFNIRLFWEDAEGNITHTDNGRSFPNRNKVTDWYSLDDFVMNDPEDGTYWFQVKAVADETGHYNSYYSEESRRFKYIKPEKKLASPNNLRWETTDWGVGFGANFDHPLGAKDGDQYEVEFYFAPTRNAEPRWEGSIWGSHHGEYPESPWEAMLQKNGPGYYYFRVRAISSDITKICNGDWSELSEPYCLDQNVQNMKDNLDKISPKAEDEVIREKVQALNTEELKAAMLADNGTEGIMDTLETLEEAVGGAADVQVSDDAAAFDADKISIVGANLNNKTDAAAEDITLVLDKPKELREDLGAQYDNAVAIQFSMDLSNVEDTENLAVPVKITLPIPENINPDFLVILHFTQSGHVEEISMPFLHVFKENGQLYTSFVLTSFSDFAMTHYAEQAEDGGELDQIQWEVTSWGNLIISGEGEMPDYDSAEDAPWYGSADQVKSIIVEEGITAIGDHAFACCGKAEAISLPESLKILGDASISCNSLEEVYIPAGVEQMGKASIDGDKLRFIDVDEDNAVFCDVDGILFDQEMKALIAYPDAKEGASYSVPEGIEVIGPMAFAGNWHLVAIELPESLLRLETKVFRNSYLDSIWFNGNPPFIAEDAFEMVYGATAFYPSRNENWTEEVLNAYKEIHTEMTWQKSSYVEISGEETVTGGKSVKLTAQILPGNPEGKPIFWALAEESMAYATLKVSKGVATVTAADVSEPHTVTVIAYSHEDVASAEHKIAIRPKVLMMAAGELVTVEEDGETVQRFVGVEKDTIVLDEEKAAGFQRQLGVEVLPWGASEEVTWTGSNNVATINADGLAAFTGKPGVVKFTATSRENTKLKATVTYTVVEAIQMAHVDNPEIDLLGGKSVTLQARNAITGELFGKKDIQWCISADDAEADIYATINASGKLTTKKVLKETRLSVIGEIISDGHTLGDIVYTVNLHPAVTQVKIEANGDVNNGQVIYYDWADKDQTQMKLKAVQYPEDAMAADVKWTVSDKKSAYANYKIEGNEITITNPKKAGTVTFTATSNEGSKKKTSVKVQFGAFADKVKIGIAGFEGKNITLVGGDKTINRIMLEATVLAKDGTDNVSAAGVKWSLEDPADKAFVSVSSKGLVTAKKVYKTETVVIVATSKDGMKSDRVSIDIVPSDTTALNLWTVNEEGTESTANVTKDTITLDMNSEKTSVTLRAGFVDNSSTEGLAWSPAKNSKTAEFTVNPDGTFTVKMLRTGKVTVTAKADKKSATVTIVGTNLAEDIEIAQKKTGKTENLVVASGKSLDLVATALNASNKKVTWSLAPGDEEFAKISSSGKLTATKDLTTRQMITVTATAQDGSDKSDTIDVTILPLAQGVQVYSEDSSAAMTFRIDSKDRVRSNSTLTWDMARKDENGNEMDLITLSAFVYPYHGDNHDCNALQDISWKSSGTKIADFVRDEEGIIVVENGKIQLKCLKPGTVTITASANDGSGKKVTFKVKVVRRIQELELSLNDSVEVTQDGQLLVKGGKSLDLSKLVKYDPTDASEKKLYWFIEDGGSGVPFAKISNGKLTTRKVTGIHDLSIIVANENSRYHAAVTLRINVLIVPN